MAQKIFFDLHIPHNNSILLKLNQTPGQSSLIYEFDLIMGNIVVLAEGS